MANRLRKNEKPAHPRSLIIFKIILELVALVKDYCSYRKSKKRTIDKLPGVATLSFPTLILFPMEIESQCRAPDKREY